MATPTPQPPDRAGPGMRRAARRRQMLAVIATIALVLPVGSASGAGLTRAPCSDGVGNVKDQIQGEIIDTLLPDWLDHPWGPEAPGDLWDRCIEPEFRKGTGPPGDEGEEEDGGPGSSSGDPHIVTLDGLTYDLQAAGDVVLLETTDGRVTIQARYHRTAPEHPYSWVDGVALGLGDARVAIDGLHLRGQPTLTVDGATVELDDLGWVAFDGGVVHRRGGTTTIVLDEGGGLRVRGSSVEVAASLDWAGEVTGTYGNGDGDPTNDLARRDGTVIDPGDPDALYGAWLDDWLVAPEESLFPKPFDVEAWGPVRPAQQLTLADLPAADVVTASAVCAEAGLTAGAGLEECTFDVALTGDETLADQQPRRGGGLVPAATVTATVDVELDVSIGTVVGPDEPADGVGRLATRSEVDQYRLAPTDAERWLVPTAPCTAPLAAVALVVVDGRVTDTLPLLCGTAHPLPTGPVTLRVADPAGVAGTYGFRISDQDDRRAAASSVPTTLDTPVDLVVSEIGNVPTATLELAAGQRVYVETLVSLPSHLSLADPSGAEVARWAPFLESGVLTAPTDGTYTLAAEPVGENTGTITLLPHDVPADLRTSAAVGDEVTLDLTTPGQRAIVTLDLDAGETFVPSTLEAVAGEYLFAGPDESVITTWRHFLDPDQLSTEASGTHTITFDPLGAATGRVRLVITPS